MCLYNVLEGLKYWLLQIFSIKISFSFLQWAGKPKQETTKVDAWLWSTLCKGRARTIVPHIIRVLKKVQTLVLRLGTMLRVPEWAKRHHVYVVICLWAFSLALYMWLLTWAVLHWGWMEEEQIILSKERACLWFWEWCFLFLPLCHYLYVFCNDTCLLFVPSFLFPCSCWQECV